MEVKRKQKGHTFQRQPLKMDVTGFFVKSRNITTIDQAGYYNNVHDSNGVNNQFDLSVIYGDNLSLGFGYDHRVARNFTKNGTMCHSKNYTVCADFIQQPTCYKKINSEMDVIVEVSTSSENTTFIDLCNINKTEIMEYALINRNGSLLAVGGYQSLNLKTFSNNTFAVTGNSTLNISTPLGYLHDILTINGSDYLIGGQRGFPDIFGYKYYSQNQNFNTNISILNSDNNWDTIYSYNNGLFMYAKEKENLYIADTLVGLYNVSFIPNGNQVSVNLDLFSNVPYDSIYGISQSAINEDFLIIFMTDIWFYSKSSKIWFRTTLETPSIFYTQFITHNNFTIGNIKSPYRVTSNGNDTNAAYFILDEDCLTLETIDIIPKRGSRLYKNNNTLFEGPGKRLFNYINGSNEITFTKSPNNTCTSCTFKSNLVDYCNFQYDCFSCVDTQSCSWTGDQCTSTAKSDGYQFIISNKDSCPQHITISPNLRYEVEIPVQGLWIRIDVLNDTCSDISIQSRFLTPVLFKFQSVPYFLRKDNHPIIFDPEISILMTDKNWFIGPMFFKLSHNSSFPVTGELRIQNIPNSYYCKGDGSTEIVLFAIMSLFILILIGSMLYIGFSYNRLRRHQQPPIDTEPPPAIVDIFSMSLHNNKITHILKEPLEIDKSNEEARLFPLSLSPYGGAHAMSFLIKKPTTSSKLHDQFAFGRVLYADKRFIAKYTK